MKKAKHPELVKLDEIIANWWSDLFQSELSEKFENTNMKYDKRVYAIYMVQVYHYAYDTPRSLAYAGANTSNSEPQLMHHFFEHAMEETAHDLMAFSDLKALKAPFNSTNDIPPALGATAKMVEYVRELSLSNQPYISLGYHYWIEQPYLYINDFMDSMLKNMKLKKKQVSFYVNHARIDKKHGKDMQKILIKVCKNEEQWQAIQDSAKKTLSQFMQIIKEVIEEYEKLISGKPTAYSILNEMPH